MTNNKVTQLRPPGNVDMHITVIGTEITVTGIPRNLDVAINILAEAVKVVSGHFVNRLVEQRLAQSKKKYASGSKSLMGPRKVGN